MSKYHFGYAEKGRCRIVHQLNKTEIITDLPPEYGGNGRSFSSTDLVAAAVGSCYLSTIEDILRRNDYRLEEIALSVTKELNHQPKQLKAINMQLFLPVQPSEKLSLQLEKAISLCPVKRSLNNKVAISVTFHVADNTR